MTINLTKLENGRYRLEFGDTTHEVNGFDGVVIVLAQALGEPFEPKEWSYPKWRAYVDRIRYAMAHLVRCILNFPGKDR